MSFAWRVVTSSIFAPSGNQLSRNCFIGPGYIATRTVVQAGSTAISHQAPASLYVTAPAAASQEGHRP